LKEGRVRRPSPSIRLVFAACRLLLASSVVLGCGPAPRIEVEPLPEVDATDAAPLAAAPLDSRVPASAAPARLVEPADLGSLPRSTLALERAGHIVRVELPSGRSTLLSREPGAYTEPRWTDDGHFVFCRRWIGGANQIVRLDSASGALRVVTRLRSGDALQWSVDGAGASVALVRAHHVVLANVATGREKLIGRDAEAPVLSRDGKTLWVVTRLGGLPEQQSVRAIDIAGGSERELVAPNETDRYEAIVEAGEELVLVRRRGSTVLDPPELLTLRIGGGAPKRLGDLDWPGELVQFAPHPTPDARKLAVWISARYGGWPGRYRSFVGVVPWGGSKAKVFVPPAEAQQVDESQPAWAPDGRHLAFTQTLCATEGCEHPEERVFLVDTHAVTPVFALVSDGSAPTFAPRSP
jgi:WD40-like Beta Propeller Repeat